MKIPVVTAITAGRDRLRPQPQLPDAEYVAFLDPEQACPGWQARPAYAGFQNPVLNAKHHKVLTHRWFPSAEYSLWIDGSVVITHEGALSELIDAYLGDADLAVFRHRVRNCAYEEGRACVRQGKADSAVVRRQLNRYRQEGYPAENGLGELSVLLRRHTPELNELCEAWWSEIVPGSRRDQLSFDYVAWKLGVTYARFPGSFYANPLFERGPHEPGTARDRRPWRYRTPWLWRPGRR